MSANFVETSMAAVEEMTRLRLQEEWEYQLDLMGAAASEDELREHLANAPCAAAVATQHLMQTLVERAESSLTS